MTANNVLVSLNYIQIWWDFFLQFQLICASDPDAYCSVNIRRRHIWVRLSSVTDSLWYFQKAKILSYLLTNECFYVLVSVLCTLRSNNHVQKRRMLLQAPHPSLKVSFWTFFNILINITTTTHYLKYISPNPSVVLKFGCLKEVSSTVNRLFLCLHF